MAHLAFDFCDVEVFAGAAPYLSYDHLKALASVLEDDFRGVHLLQRAGNDDCPAVGTCRHLEQVVAFADGFEEISRLGIEAEVYKEKSRILEFQRKKTTQKVNLYEKVQIPGYKEAIRKIKRYMEDEENLSKASSKIVKSRHAAEEDLEEEATV